MAYGRSLQLSVVLQMKYLPWYIYFILQDLLMCLLKLESSEATERRKEMKQMFLHIYHLDRSEDAWIFVLSRDSGTW